MCGCSVILKLPPPPVPPPPDDKEKELEKLKEAEKKRKEEEENKCCCPVPFPMIPGVCGPPPPFAPAAIAANAFAAGLNAGRQGANHHVSMGK